MYHVLARIICNYVSINISILQYHFYCLVYIKTKKGHPVSRSILQDSRNNMEIY